MELFIFDPETSSALTVRKERAFYQVFNNNAINAHYRRVKSAGVATGLQQCASDIL